MTLLGPELKPGDPAPDFEVVDTSLAPVSLRDTAGKTRIFSVVPSLDTPVCDAQTKRFNDELGTLDGIEVYTVSMDLPFGQKRWCDAFGIDRVKMLSDHRSGSFGESYGTLIKELRMEGRAVFVVGKDDRIRYAQYVKEVADAPDYEAALEAAKAATDQG